jgi:hypothetical protein
LKLLSTGVSGVDFKGEDYNLTDVRDFIGVYHGASMGMKIVKSLGPGEIATNNSKCVLIKAKGSGLELNPPGPGGFYVQFTE